jgi:hypothetical protein
MRLGCSPSGQFNYNYSSEASVPGSLDPRLVPQYVLLLWVCLSLPEFQLSGQVVKVDGEGSICLMKGTVGPSTQFDMFCWVQLVMYVLRFTCHVCAL